MRRLLMLCVFIFVGLLASEFEDANAAVTWSTGASIVAKDTGVIEQAAISPGAVGPPDVDSGGGTWTVTTQVPNTVDKNIEAQWTFSGGAPGDMEFFALFRKVSASNVILAQVVRYYSVGGPVGGTAVTGTTVSPPLYSGSPGLYVHLPFTLPGAATTITAINVKFTLKGYSNFKIDAFGVPEPGTLALFGAGLLGMGIWAGRRRKRRAS